ncbi:chemotaxis-specific protein-glutamate methyltransferase CheB [Maritalea sp.]|uniref:chemotaxis-specific protein-glutamate methyltransferase CheB n=1 Tax=Maritalea sp. TaxID=2003361 RepID=UPI003EFAAB67
MEAQLMHGAKSAPARVMLVDDSAVIRGIIRRWIEDEPTLHVVASATNGHEAIEEAKITRPDLIVLDLEMPVMTGMDALPELIKIVPDAKILISSALTTKNARVSLAAISAGATDYLAKPDVGSSRETYRIELLGKLRALASTFGPADLVVGSGKLQLASERSWKGKMSVLAIGASTGGPQALSDLFDALSGQLDECAVLVTQHMPAHFTRLLGEDLAKRAKLFGGEAIDGAEIKPGHLYIAPGGFHMRVEKRDGQVRVGLGTDPAINFCKPSVDPMFQSIVSQYGANCVGVILTGMGSDGTAGAEAIYRAGGLVIAQDQATSTVWGMPGAAVSAGVVDRMLALPKIGPAILAAKGNVR